LKNNAFTSYWKIFDFPYEASIVSLGFLKHPPCGAPENPRSNNLLYIFLWVMARNALKVKQARLEQKKFAALAAGVKMDKATRYYNRCKLCGRQASFIRDFGICRVCLRKYARDGLIVGLKKASR